MHLLRRSGHRASSLHRRLDAWRDWRGQPFGLRLRLSARGLRVVSGGTAATIPAATWALFYDAIEEEDWAPYYDFVDDISVFLALAPPAPDIAPELAAATDHRFHDPALWGEITEDPGDPGTDDAATVALAPPLFPAEFAAALDLPAGIDWPEAEHPDTPADEAPAILSQAGPAAVAPEMAAQLSLFPEWLWLEEEQPDPGTDDAPAILSQAGPAAIAPEIAAQLSPLLDWVWPEDLDWPESDADDGTTVLLLPPPPTPFDPSLAGLLALPPDWSVWLEEEQQLAGAEDALGVLFPPAAPPTFSKAVALYGASGTDHGMAALSSLSTEQTFEFVAVPGWAPHAGQSLGWAEFVDGKLFICGQGTNLNALLPSMVDDVVSIFDPAGPALTHIVVPTSTGATSVIGSNGVTGGAYVADVAVVHVGAEDYVCFIVSGPYAGWQITGVGGKGLYPTFQVFRKSGGVWGYASAGSKTGDDLHNSGNPGSQAYPWTTNGFAEQLALNLATSEIEFTPASKVAICVQYLDDAVNTSHHGGRIVAIDPATGAVLAQHDIAFFGVTGLTKMGPRALMVDPTGTLGTELFWVNFDCFNGSVDAGFNVGALFSYDHVNAAITQVSGFLKVNDLGDHWASGGFDDAGNLWLGTRSGPFAWGYAYCYPKIAGSIRPAKYPYGVKEAAFGTACPPEVVVDVVASTGVSVQMPWGRARFDPTTGVVWWITLNGRLVGVKRLGSGSSLRGQALPVIDLGYFSTIDAAEDCKFTPSDPAIDVTGRSLWAPIAGLDTPLTCPSYPCTPRQLPQFLVRADLDRIGATPILVGSTHGGSLSTPVPLAVTLPLGWRAGDLVLVYALASLTDLDPDFTVPPGWVQASQVSNGGGIGGKYACFYRVMKDGDAAPSLTWDLGGPTKTTAYVCLCYRGVDPQNPINASGTLKANTGTTDNRPSVTPTVTGCRILGFYGAFGVQTFTGLSGEIARTQQNGVLGVSPSCLATEEETLAGAGPTTARAVTLSVSHFHEGLTLAIAPEPSPAATVTVYHDMVLSDGRPATDVLVELEVHPATDEDRTSVPSLAQDLIGPSVLPVNGNGRWTVDVTPQVSIFPQGSRYRVVEHLPQGPVTWDFIVPPSGGPYSVSDLPTP